MCIVSITHNIDLLKGSCHTSSDNASECPADGNFLICSSFLFIMYVSCPFHGEEINCFIQQTVFNMFITRKGWYHACKLFHLIFFKDFPIIFCYSNSEICGWPLLSFQYYLVFIQEHLGRFYQLTTMGLCLVLSFFFICMTFINVTW